MASRSRDAKITKVEAAAYRIPTDAPEGDGTFDWDATTLVVVEVDGGGKTGLGYTYADAAAAQLVNHTLSHNLLDQDCFDIPRLVLTLRRQVRNIGRSGVSATAISAIDVALWDLKGKLLSQPLTQLLGRCRDNIMIYGSGGFTTYSDDQIRDQLAGWVERDGCRAVKMKIGRDPHRDLRRITVARSAIGETELFVDANGAFSSRRALALLADCTTANIRWFEEPVSSDDLPGLRLIRQSAPAAVEIAAGEYIFTIDDARMLLEEDCVDVLQADATRCGGVSGFLQIGTLCEAYHRDLSGHCAPAIHLHLACSTPRLRHLEWFHDHVRIEQMLFDGAPVPHAGLISPDLSRPGIGLEFKRQDAEQFHIPGAGR